MKNETRTYQCNSHLDSITKKSLVNLFRFSFCFIVGVLNKNYIRTEFEMT